MARRPRSSQCPDEDGPACKKNDRKSRQYSHSQKTNSDIQASAAQERMRVKNVDPEIFAAHRATGTIQQDTRVQKMDPETFTDHQATRTSQEDTIVQNMDPEEESDHLWQHSALERTILHHLIIQKQ